MALKTEFKIGADTSGFRRGLAGIRQDVRKLAHDINRDSAKAIGRQLKSAIGPIAVGTAALVATKTAMAEAKAVRDNAAAHKLSIEEEQAAEIARKQFGDTANVTADQFAEAVAKIIESGQVMSTETVKQLAASQDQWESAMLSIKTLVAPALTNLADSMQAVVNWTLRMTAGFKAFISGSPDPTKGPANAFNEAVEAERARQDFIKRNQTFNAESREIAPGDSSPSRFNQFLGRKDTEVKPTPTIKEARPIERVQGDQLQRAGLFIGGPPTVLLGIQKQQLAELKAIKDQLRLVRDSVEEI